MSKQTIIATDTSGMDLDLIAKKLAKFEQATRDERPLKATVKIAYNFVDTFMDEIRKINPSPCSKGCNACCNYKVDITPVEALMIHEQYDVPINLEMGQHVYYWKKGTKICPFNKDGECQVYEWRPIMCRSFMSIEETKEPCYTEDGGGHISYKSNQAIIDLITFLGTEHPQLRGGGDIRHYFGEEPITVKP